MIRYVDEDKFFGVGFWFFRPTDENPEYNVVFYGGFIRGVIKLDKDSPIIFILTRSCTKIFKVVENVIYSIKNYFLSTQEKFLLKDISTRALILNIINATSFKRK